MAAIQFRDNRGVLANIWDPADGKDGLLFGLDTDQGDTYVVDSIPTGMTVNYFPGGPFTCAVAASVAPGNYQIAGRWHDLSANLVRSWTEPVTVT